MMQFAIWLFLGVLAVMPLLVWGQQTDLATTRKIFSGCLMLAAAVYVGFSLVFDGGSAWLSIEALSVLIYGGFCWLAGRFSLLWLAVGWLLHPVWDMLHLWGPGQHLAPAWYTVACIAFDIVVAAYLVYRVQVSPPPSV